MSCCADVLIVPDLCMAVLLWAYMFVCAKHSWVKRLRDKFKKFRSRSRELSEDVQAMKLKYGRKRPLPNPTTATDTETDDVSDEQMLKVQRVFVSDHYWSAQLSNGQTASIKFRKGEILCFFYLWGLPWVNAEKVGMAKPLRHIWGFLVPKPKLSICRALFVRVFPCCSYIFSWFLVYEDCIYFFVFTTIYGLQLLVTCKEM